jgi:hypothetical protein
MMAVTLHRQGVCSGAARCPSRRGGEGAPAGSS